MAERRTLTEGLMATPTPAEVVREHQFVYGEKPSQLAAAAPVTTTAPHTRSPLTTRIRSDFAAALKRASLERQLSGTHPSTLQDILEEAIEPWLKSNGYGP